MTTQKEPDKSWTKYNHLFISGIADDGYAVCVNCRVKENEDAIVYLCPKGPISLGKAYLHGPLSGVED